MMSLDDSAGKIFEVTSGTDVFASVPSSHARQRSHRVGIVEAVCGCCQAVPANLNSAAGLASGHDDAANGDIIVSLQATHAFLEGFSPGGKR